jgi:hypothetical protein
MNKIRKTNKLRDAAELASAPACELMREARTLAMQIDLQGASDALRQAQNVVIQVCLDYERRLDRASSALLRTQEALALSNRQILDMQSFMDSAAQPDPAAAKA